MLDFIRLKCTSRVQTQNDPSFAAGWATSGLMRLYTDPLTCLHLPASSSPNQVQIFLLLPQCEPWSFQIWEMHCGRLWKYTGNLDGNTLPNEVMLQTPEKEQMERRTWNLIGPKKLLERGCLWGSCLEMVGRLSNQWWSKPELKGFLWATLHPCFRYACQSSRLLTEGSDLWGISFISAVQTQMTSRWISSATLFEGLFLKSF